MALKTNFNESKSLTELMKKSAMVEDDIIRSMQYAGEKFVRDAREMTKAQGGFGDVTGNLRSSIGYFILKDGEIIQEDFKGNTVGQSTSKSELAKIGKSRGYQLIGIAGMEYASHVESRGLNVISNQADIAVIDLDRFWKIIETKHK